MFSLSYIVILVVALHGIYSLKCYTGSYYPNGGNTLTTVDSTITDIGCNSTTCVCASYQFQCTGNDSACTAAQLQNQTIIWGYNIQENATCQSEISSQPMLYMNGTCCSTDFCNNQGLNSTTTPPNSSPTSFLPTYMFIFALCLSFIRV